MPPVCETTIGVKHRPETIGFLPRSKPYYGATWSLGKADPLALAKALLGGRNTRTPQPIRTPRSWKKWRRANTMTENDEGCRRTEIALTSKLLSDEAPSLSIGISRHTRKRLGDDSTRL